MEKNCVLRNDLPCMNCGVCRKGKNLLVPTYSMKFDDKWDLMRRDTGRILVLDESLDYVNTLIKNDPARGNYIFNILKEVI